MVRKLEPTIQVVRKIKPIRRPVARWRAKEDVVFVAPDLERADAADATNSLGRAATHAEKTHLDQSRVQRVEVSDGMWTVFGMGEGQLQPPS